MSLPAKRMRPESGVNWPAELRDQRGLAGAVRPDHGVQFALRDVERQVVGGDDAAEALGEILDLQQRAQLMRAPCADRSQQAVDAAAREQHDQQQQRPEDDLPIFGDAGRAASSSTAAPPRRTAGRTASPCRRARP